MRIVQLIDSLEAGGAERMAVSFANSLASKIEFSGLIVSRKEGSLLSKIIQKENYLLLDKKTTFDWTAVFKFKTFVKTNKIEIVHAHGTSFFLAFLLKLVYPKIKIIWHEHYGARANQSRLQNLIVLFCSLFFAEILVVNRQLEKWAKTKLFTKKVEFIPNFAFFETAVDRKTVLNGEDGKRIVLLANLKNPKNHLFALTAFHNSKIEHSGWSLHFVGKDFNDEYSANLKKYIDENNLTQAIFFYDAKSDIENILSQASIGILTSTDEGFPVSILEYAQMKLLVISTNVGYCSEIIQNNADGLLFKSNDLIQFQNHLIKMTSDIALRQTFALNLYLKITNQYSQEKVIDLLIENYHTI